jgi:hypothetical protein
MKQKLWLQRVFVLMNFQWTVLANHMNFGKVLGDVCVYNFVLIFYVEMYLHGENSIL